MSDFFVTVWSYLSGLLLAALAGFYIKSRCQIVKLKKCNLEIMRILSAKTIELQENAKKLNILENSIKANGQKNEQMTSTLLHDLRSPLRFLSTISRSVISDFNSRTGEANLEYLIKLHKSIGALWRFVETSYAWDAGQQDTNRQIIQSVPIQDVFNSVTDFYGEVFAYSGNHLEVIPTDVCWHTDRDILHVIVRNLLDNANKYTEGGRICLSCHQVNEKLRIVVKDSGKGLEKSQIQSFIQVFTRDRQGGHGSRIIAHMLNKIDGQLSINSEPEKGSVFTIELKKMKARLSSNLN